LLLIVVNIFILYYDTAGWSTLTL